MVNSRQKGKNGELELAHILNQYGYDTKRGQQYSGANGDADVIGLPGIHIEVKRQETMQLNKWLMQSVDDAYADSIKHGGHMIPVVIHRENCDRTKQNNIKGKWKVSMLLDDFMVLYEKGRTNA